MDEEIQKIFRPFDIDIDEWNKVDKDKLYLIAVKSCGRSQFKKDFEQFKEHFYGRKEIND